MSRSTSGCSARSSPRKAAPTTPGARFAAPSTPRRDSRRCGSSCAPRGLYASFLAAGGQSADARAALAPVVERLTEGFDVRDAVAARALLETLS